ncbi:LysR family transcriptional regulator [Azohydromonas caseinilytica]|uniref:LysR family transcriptional regulator n=1 Tax=Azohydromonas caseinilytica TaxID=2728836 RepID=A0A848FDU8_9BURK|nr:LysR family transcriptional regulator [Azohydromonas caseinilytica]NML17196.1 LysR family transcriptional regulator [Azohydromonas caseinilytica]
MRHDLTSLELFVAVAECGNLTRAAERQHLAVSAVSKRIGELEALARTPLLVRQPRGVALTPAGQSLLHHARQMLLLVRRMDEELGQYAGGMKGHIRLHAVASALTQFLPEELEAFLTRHPDVQVSLEERTGKAVARAVADGSADLGIVASAAAQAGLDTLPYRTDRLMLGVPRDHPLARRKAVRFADALAYPFVGPHAESSLSALMQQGAQACGRALQQRVQVSSFDAMCRLVETRLGITLLPAGVLAPHVAAGRLQGVDLKEAWAERHMAIVVRDTQALSHITRALIAHLQQAAGSSRG